MRSALTVYVVSGSLLATTVFAGCSTEGSGQPNGPGGYYGGTGGGFAPGNMDAAISPGPGVVPGAGGMPGVGGIPGAGGMPGTGGNPGTGGEPGTAGITGAAGQDMVVVDAGTVDGGGATGIAGAAGATGTAGAAGATGGTGGSSTVIDSGTGGDCNLTGTVGLAVGNLTPDITLYECDGTPVQLYDLICDAAYTFIYSYAGW